MAMLAALLCCAPFLAPLTQEPSRGQASASEAVPETFTVLARVWIPSPAQLADGLVGEAGLLHGLWGTPLWSGVQELPGFPMAQMAWDTLLRPVDGELESFLNAFAGDGLTLVAARRGDGPIGYGLVASAQDADTAQECLQPLLNFAGIKNAQMRGEEWQLQLDQSGIARHGSCFALGGSPDSAFHLAEELAKDDPSRRAIASLIADHPGAAAVYWLDSSLLQQGGESMLPKDAGASLFGAEWHEAFRTASWVGGQLQVGDGRLLLGLEVPAPADLRQTHAPFFPAVGSVRLPQLQGHMATMILPRDLGAWWTARDAYMSEQAVADTIEGDANLALLFARDPGSEIFAQLEPVMTLLVAELPAAETEGLAVEFPAAALGMKRRATADEDLGAAFANAFLGAVLFSNFSNGAMGAELLQVDVEALPQGKLYTAIYRKPAPGVTAPARHNLSPSLLLADDGEIWLSSSAGLLRELAAAPREEVGIDSISMEILAAPAVALLRRDREALVAQRLLEEGGDEQAASQFVDMVLQAAALLDGLSVQSGLHQGLLFVEVETRVRF